MRTEFVMFSTENINFRETMPDQYGTFCSYQPVLFTFKYMYTYNVYYCIRNSLYIKSFGIEATRALC